MIWNPWWASISMDNPALPYLKEIVNLVNVDSLVTTVFTADEDEKNVGLHSKCHTVFTPKEGQLDEYLKAMLDHFFVTHDAIKQNLQQLGSAASESVNKERTKVKGFAAYKENSTPLSSVEEEKNKECFHSFRLYESCFDVWFKATLFFPFVIFILNNYLCLSVA